MKKTLLTLGCLSALLISSCGGGTSGDALAQEVCDCYKKANGMDASDPKRAEEQQKCLTMQSEKWEKIKDNKEEGDKFNQKISDCGKEMIQESLSNE